MSPYLRQYIQEMEEAILWLKGARGALPEFTDYWINYFKAVLDTRKPDQIEEAWKQANSRGVFRKIKQWKRDRP